MGSEVDVMQPDQAEQMAFDVACGFFNDDQLCRRYGLSLDQLNAVKQQPGFLAIQDEQDRLLRDDGSEFLVKAKGYAGDALDSLWLLARRARSETVRQKAAVSLLEYARVPTGREVATGGSGGPTIVINTNLGLNQEPKGTYVAEVKPAMAQRVADDNGDLV